MLKFDVSRLDIAEQSVKIFVWLNKSVLVVGI